MSHWKSSCGKLPALLISGSVATVLCASGLDRGFLWSPIGKDAAVATANVRSMSAHSEMSSPTTVVAETMMAQQRGGSDRGGFGGGRGGYRAPPDRSSYPTWEKDPRFPDDVFTFARIRYSSASGYGFRGRAWDNDFPDCDWNFSVRLHQLTSMKVDPNGVVIDMIDPKLLDYPFAYMSNVGNMSLSAGEAEAMRRYLLNGGFIMADDFWAPGGWENVRREMEKVFPNRKPRELSRDHEIFHIVYHLKTKPQVPSIRAWQRGYTFEYWHGDPQGDEEPHFWGYFDDAGRLMALMCHNNDIGDGWEREGDNEEYFRDYSVRVSYPLGINIITYAMTH
ncbi:MAG: DUF4159 domain-containing protein [Pirellulaceae bacterium]|nr:DUF4159 domain-containing protein [Pirellulaceae bacterium]